MAHALSNPEDRTLTEPASIADCNHKAFEARDKTKQAVAVGKQATHALSTTLPRASLLPAVARTPPHYLGRLGVLAATRMTTQHGIEDEEKTKYRRANHAPVYTKQCLCEKSRQPTQREVQKQRKAYDAPCIAAGE